MKEGGPNGGFDRLEVKDVGTDEWTESGDDLSVDTGVKNNIRGVKESK